MQNCPNHSIKVVHYLVIPESNDTIAEGCQLTRALSIAVCLCEVGTSIEFDDEAVLKCAEVHNISANRVLSAKAHAAQFASAQEGPELGLGRSRRRAKPTGVLVALGRGSFGWHLRTLLR